MGGGEGRGGFLLVLEAVPSFYHSFFPPLCCSLSFSEDTVSLIYCFFYIYNGAAFILFIPCSPSVGQIFAFYFSLFGPRPHLSSLYWRHYPFFLEHCQIQPQIFSLSKKGYLKRLTLSWKTTETSFKWFLFHRNMSDVQTYERSSDVSKDQIRSAFWCIYGWSRH